MSRRLPPLSALRAFEAAARHGSFQRAAAELAVTPTAISHQIRSLEEHTGLALFERRTRKVALTEAGAQLYPVLRYGFDTFADELGRLTQRRSRAQVTISATIAFTAKWLLPRMAAFRDIHPEIDLQLHASDEVLDLSGGIDIAIRYGQGPYPGFAAEMMFADTFAPVVNPILGVTSPADLARIALVEFQWRRNHAANPTWARWFVTAGLGEMREQAQLRFSDESHAIQAAVAGQGVALVSLALVADDIAAGHLVQPFGPMMPGHRYHLLTSADGSATPAVVVAAEWLLSEAQRSSPAGT